MQSSELQSLANGSLLEASGAPSGADFWRCSKEVDWRRLERALLANDATLPQDRYETRHIVAGAMLVAILTFVFLGLAFVLLREPGALVCAAAAFLGAGSALAFARAMGAASQAVANREGGAFVAAFDRRMGAATDGITRADYVETALRELSNLRKIDMAHYRPMAFLEYRAFRSIRVGKSAPSKPNFAEMFLLRFGAGLRALTGAEKFIHVAGLLDDQTAWRLVEQTTPAEYHRIEALAIGHSTTLPETATRSSAKSL
jgi:hypothetical protein